MTVCGSQQEFFCVFGHTIIKMAFIKEESEDVKIEETFRVKQEDTEEQTGWFSFSFDAY